MHTHAHTLQIREFSTVLQADPSTSGLALSADEIGEKAMC